MHCEDLLAALCCLLSVIGRSKEIRALQHDVVGPLLFSSEEERVAKEALMFVLMVEHQHFLQGGRAAYTESGWTTWEFDVTGGFPVEDISSPSQVFNVC